jgi:SAM-dependent methyltransferase
MKQAALRLLVCPGCGDALELRAARNEGPEVMEGSLLSAGCRRSYPIRGGVPRFVDHGAYAASFGFQWNRFGGVQLDSRSGLGESERTLEGVTGWTERDYRGRLVLDAGVGSGRFTEIAAAKGGEVVGFDLTEAVDAAFDNVGRHPRVHLIQADLFQMPFRAASFDLAYSVGVLHHTPDPRAAFARLSNVVRPGGGLAVYLYDRYGPAHRSNDALRRLTTRLPRRLMLGLSAAAIPLYYLYRVPLLGSLLRAVAPISEHADWRWRWLDTFDWYTPRYQWKFLYPEIHRWFLECGFEDIRLFDGPIRMRGTRRAAGDGQASVARRVDPVEALA